MITKYFGKSKRIFVANIEGNIFDQHVRRGKRACEKISVN